VADAIGAARPPATGPRVVVVGSVNLDVALTVDALPAGGETVIASHRHEKPGGKGANQAVAAARAGALVSFFGACGLDPAGEMSLSALQSEGIDTSAVVRLPQERTGEAVVVVDSDGENLIVVTAGANARLDAVSVQSALRAVALSSRDVLLVGFEIPETAVVAAVQLAALRGAGIVVNPAPARPLHRELTSARPILIPNESEALKLSGSQDVHSAARRLCGMTSAPVMVSWGKRGAVLCAENRLQVVSAPTVTALDTTGAGDTLAGVFAAALADGSKLLAAARRATVAASLSVRKAGARDGMPTAGEIDEADTEQAASPAGTC
jgi:ribokinase